jgi:hypothetical protein
MKLIGVPPDEEVRERELRLRRSQSSQGALQDALIATLYGTPIGPMRDVGHVGGHLCRKYPLEGLDNIIKGGI